MNKTLFSFCTKILHIIIILCLLMPLSVIEGMGLFGVQKAFAAGQNSTTGIFRLLIQIPDEGSLLRLDRTGVKILKDGTWTLILATGDQLEDLVKLGFDTDVSIDLGTLVNANRKSGSISLESLQPDLKQAESLWAVVEKERRARMDNSSAQESALADLNKIVDSFSATELVAIASLISPDSDSDGLTDTEESWWCTNPLTSDTDSDGKNDGSEIQLLKDWVQNKRNAAPSETPWPNWPFNPVTCPDKDLDSIPNMAERWVLGLNMDLESTDRDKFDDGQEVFGVTYCPGGDLSCNYGDLPRSADSGYVGATMPAWVKSPGKHPLVAAFPIPEVYVVPGSWTVTPVTTITTEEGQMTQTAHTYETSVTRGEETSISNTETWNNWEEVSQAVETPLNGAMQSASVSVKGVNWGKVIGGTAQILGGAAAIGLGCFGGLVTGPGEVPLCAAGLAAGVPAIGGGISDWSDVYTPDEVQTDLNVNNYNNNLNINNVSSSASAQASAQVVNNIDFQGIASSLDGIQYAINQQGQLIARGLHDISYQLARPRLTETRTNGNSYGGSQTTTNAVYEEHTISQGEAFTSGQNWSTAWAVDSSHSADLTFNYYIANTGTEYAREIQGFVFNVYLGDDPNPLISYPAWQQFSGGKLQNIFPGEQHNFASNPIPLTIEQMKRIDLGEKLIVVLEDFSYGADELFYQNATQGGVTVYIEDGVDDNNELVDSYVIPTWGSESVQDILARYFPIGVDTSGDINSMWSPEFNGINPPTWNEHYLSNIAWWNIYMTQSNVGDAALKDIPAQAGSMILFRFNRDSDLDGYKDSVELHYGTDKNDPASHPQPEILAGYVTSRVGNEVTVLLKLSNSGSFDAYGIDAVMYSPDGSTTITNNTVGGNGRVKAGAQVAVGSIVKDPDLTNWKLSTARPYANGNYTGAVDETLTFTINTAGTVGQGNTKMNWSSTTGASGTIDLGSIYRAPLPVEIHNGLQVGFNTGTIKVGDSFTIQALTPRDTFKYTINQEPYTEPVIVVSYSDLQGSHRFITHEKLADLDENLFTQNIQMVPAGKLDILANEIFTPDTNNTTSLVVTNHPAGQIEDAHLYLNFVSDGQLVQEMPIMLDLGPGPTTYSANWNPVNFSQSYNPNGDNILIAFWTDSEGNIIDSAARPFTTFQKDPKPNPVTSATEWNLGILDSGVVKHQQVSIANTGNTNLALYATGNSYLNIFPEEIQTVSPGGVLTFDVEFRSAGLPVGAFQQTIAVRTNAPGKEIINLTFSGEISASGSGVAAYEYDEFRPWDEYINVAGPKADNSTWTYSPSVVQSPDLKPMQLLNDQEAVVGKSDVIVNAMGNQNVTYSNITIAEPQTTYPEEYVQAAKDINRNIEDAVEMVEYRTTYSRVYVWPDGYGLAVSGIEDLSASVENTASTCGSTEDGYVHFYYGGAYPQFGQTHMFIGTYLGFYKERARSYIKFCLPTLPQYNAVSSATMNLYMYSPNGSNTIGSNVYQVTSNWSEGAPFDGNHQPSLSGPVSSADINKSVGWKSWNITGLVQNWYSGTPNFGVMLAASPENANGVAFYTRENGANTPHIIVTFTLTPPSTAPALNPVDNAVGNSSYVVSWSSVANATSYILHEQKDGGTWSNIYSGANVSVSVSGRAAGTWCYKVQAVNSAGNGPESSTRCTTVRPTTTPILANISNPSGGGIYTVSWSSVVGALTYTLEENHNSGPWTGIYSGSSLSQNLTGRTSGVWCYRVKANNAGGSTDWSNTKCSIVNTAPNPPINLLPANGAGQLGRALTFSWADGGDPDNAPNAYREFQAQVTNPQSSWSNLSARSQSLSSQVIMPEDGIYNWKAQAFDGLETSNWTSTQSISVYSITKPNETQVAVALPASVTDYARYHLKYGIYADLTAAQPSKVVQVNIQKRTYADIRFDVILASSNLASPTLRIDIGNDGMDVWVQNLSWSGSPVGITSPNLSQAFNDFLAESPASFGSEVNIPVSISLDTPGKILLTNLVLTSGVDRDLSIDAADISLNTANPVEGSMLSIQSTIRNEGYLGSGPVSVSYYTTMPNGSDAYIGSDFIPNILGQNSAPSQVEWNTLGFSGALPIRVVVDPYQNIDEANEENNQASQNVSVLTRPDLQLATMAFSNLEPVVGENVTVAVNIENQGQAYATPSQMALLNNDVVIDQESLGIAGTSSNQTSLTWIPSSPGLYRILANADYADSLNELNEDNNQLWQDIYVGFADRLALDSGGATDQAYLPENGFGYLETTTESSTFCGTTPKDTQRKDNDGNLTYRFDHLLSGHFYHLDIVLYECDGLGRQQTVKIDDNQAGDAIDLSDGQPHQISLRLDPALYTDHSIDVRIDELIGYDVVISEINLIDIDYRYSDSGGVIDPAYSSNTLLKYGWLDGVKNVSWGSLPSQSRRIDLGDSDPSDDPDNELRYRFDNLNTNKIYKLSLVFFQQTGGAASQVILINGEQQGVVNLNGLQREDMEIQIPVNAYQPDGSIVVTMRRLGATTGAFVNEIALEELTIGNILPRVTSITRVNANPVNALSIDYLVTFSENVTGLDTSAPFDDFSLYTNGITGASVTSVNGSGNVYSVSVSTGLGDGIIRLDIVDNGNVLDMDGNPLSGGFNVGEEYTIDKTAPNTSIVTRPVNPSKSAAPAFTFSSTDNTAIFECQLDGSIFASCASPKTYSGVNDGPHTFKVRAKDVAGNTDSTPEEYTWVVDTIAPETALDGAPQNPSSNSNATFTFHSSNDISANFECKLDGGVYAACSSPAAYINLNNGAHTFYVRAKDLAGNTDATPISHTWIIDATAPSALGSVRTGSNPTGASTVQFNVTFSESVLNVDTTDFTVVTTGGISGASVSSVGSNGNQASYTVTVTTGTGDGTLRLDLIDDDTITDGIGNKLGGAGVGNGNFVNGETYTIQKENCYTLNISHTGQGDNPTASPPNSSGCAAGTYTSGQSVSLSGAIPSDGWQISSWIGTINDASIATTNALIMPFASHSVLVNYLSSDNASPIVVSVLRAVPSPTSSTTIDFIVTFSESVTGVDAGDFDLATSGVSSPTISGVGGSGSVYTVTVNTGSGNGTIRLNVVDDNSIVDAASNPLGGANVGDGDFINGQIYTIIKSATFADVPLSYWSNSSIERLYNAGITGGCTTVPLNYCPATPVTRAQMAVFLLRGMHGSTYTPPPATGTKFADVPLGTFGAAWIEQLAVEGITSGCGSGNYCPNTTVSRAQMAIFLVRAKHGVAFTPPTATGIFPDVPVGSFGANYIEQLVADAITSGCGGGNYCPNTMVKRDSMAVFLVKTFNLP